VVTRTWIFIVGWIFSRISLSVTVLKQNSSGWNVNLVPKWTLSIYNKYTSWKEVWQDKIYMLIYLLFLYSKKLFYKQVQIPKSLEPKFMIPCYMFICALIWYSFKMHRNFFTNIWRDIYRGCIVHIL